MMIEPISYVDLFSDKVEETIGSLEGISLQPMTKRTSEVIPESCDNFWSEPSDVETVEAKEAKDSALSGELSFSSSLESVVVELLYL